MKTVRLQILTTGEVRERLADFGAAVPEDPTAEQLANLYAEYLEVLPPGVDVVG